MTKLIRNRIKTLKRDILTLALNGTKNSEKFAKDYTFIQEFIDELIEEVQKPEEEQPDYTEEF
jgi:hypothetical protein